MLNIQLGEDIMMEISNEQNKRIRRHQTSYYMSCGGRRVEEKHLPPLHHNIYQLIRGYDDVTITPLLGYFQRKDIYIEHRASWRKMTQPGEIFW
jgi:hypothetical protein